MLTRREFLKKSASVAGVVATTALLPGIALAKMKPKEPAAMLQLGDGERAPVHFNVPQPPTQGYVVIPDIEVGDSVSIGGDLFKVTELTDSIATVSTASAV